MGAAESGFTASCLGQRGNNLRGLSCCGLGLDKFATLSLRDLDGELQLIRLKVRITRR